MRKKEAPEPGLPGPYALCPVPSALGPGSWVPGPLSRSLFPVVLTFMLAGLLVACGGPGSAGSTNPDTTPDAPASTVVTAASEAVSTSTILPTVTATTPLDVVAVFLTVVDEAMAGTEFAEYGFDAPEDVLLLGQMFCELRDAGYTEEESLTAHLENLAEIREVTEEDAQFAGTVMGAAFATLCPSTD